MIKWSPLLVFGPITALLVAMVIIHWSKKNYGQAMIYATILSFWVIFELPLVGWMAIHLHQQLAGLFHWS
jgi:hypothetical protein